MHSNACTPGARCRHVNLQLATIGVHGDYDYDAVQQRHVTAAMSNCVRNYVTTASGLAVRIWSAGAAVVT